MKKDLNALQVVSASSLMEGALQAALIQNLIRKNITSEEDGREIYEQALLLLETSQTKSSSQAVFEAAPGDDRASPSKPSGPKADERALGLMLLAWMPTCGASTSASIPLPQDRSWSQVGERLVCTECVVAGSVNIVPNNTAAPVTAAHTTESAGT